MGYQVRCAVFIISLLLHRPSPVVRLELCIGRCNPGSRDPISTPRHTSAALKPDGVVIAHRLLSNVQLSDQNDDRSCEFRRCWYSPALNQFTLKDPFKAGTKVRDLCCPPRCRIAARPRSSQTGFHADHLVKRRRKKRQFLSRAV